MPAIPFRPMRSLPFSLCLLLVLIFSWPWVLPAAAMVDSHPLAPPDTASPRNTLAYFTLQINQAYQIQLVSGFRNREARNHIQKASWCLDLSAVAPARRQDTGFEAALLLKEILDRLDIPPADDIPDAERMASGNQIAWTLPHTEIIISRIKEGPYEGKFLFSAETVARLKEFYNRIKVLPYRAGASVGIYEDYIFSPGPLIPNRFINSLPHWAQEDFFEQALWQWISVFLLLGAGAGVVAMVFSWFRSLKHGAARSVNRLSWRQFVPPVALFFVSGAVRYLLDEQINITGTVLGIFASGLRFLLFFSACWLILLSGQGVTEVIVSSPRLRPRNIDPNLTRLICKLITWILLLVLVWNVSRYIGISFTAVFASAGIAGVALALAARETLGNFFGGISILMDRPFKTGDFILLESGERGMVVNVGMRSTRIMTRDDIQIAIPNSILTNTKVINQSAPHPRFRLRIKLGVAYGSDIDQVEKTLLTIARSNRLVSPTPEPRVRFRSFGDSALEFELLCWVPRPHDKGRLVHELNRKIYETFKAEGIEIPFPQRDVHLIDDSQTH